MFAGDRHQDITILVVKVVLDLFNYNPINVEPEKEVVTFFNVILNNNNSAPIKQTGQKSL